MSVVNMATNVGKGGKGAGKRRLVRNPGPELRRKRRKLENQGEDNTPVGGGKNMCIACFA